MGSTFARRADAVAETQRPRKVAATRPGCRLRPGTATGRRQPRPIAANVFVEVLGAPGAVEVPPRHLGFALAPCPVSVRRVSSRPDTAAGTVSFPGSLCDTRATARRHDPSGAA